MTDSSAITSPTVSPSTSGFVPVKTPTPEKSDKIVRCADNAFEFKIPHSPLLLKKKEIIQFTKTMRVILPIERFSGKPSPNKMQLKRYEEIMQLIIDEAGKLAAKDNKPLSKKYLKKITVVGKNSGTKWVIRGRKKTLFHRIAQLLSRLNIVQIVQKYDKQAFKTLELSEKFSLSEKIRRLFRKKRAEQSIFQSDPHIPVISDFSKKNTRGIDSKKFVDPFTEIATYAYKYLERDFVTHDGKVLEDSGFSDYTFILNKDKVTKIETLTLIHKNDLKDEHVESVARAAARYKEHLLAEYGQEKCTYMAHNARYDLSELVKLSPQHVYRFNILACNVESDDIASMIQKMHYASLSISESDTKSLHTFLLEKKSTLFSLEEIQRIMRWVKKESGNEEPTSGIMKTLVSKIMPQENLTYKTGLIKRLIYLDGIKNEEKTLEKYFAKPKIKALFSTEEELKDFLELLSSFPIYSGETPKVKDFHRAVQFLYQIKRKIDFKSDDMKNQTTLREFHSLEHLKIPADNRTSSFYGMTLQEFSDQLREVEADLSTKQMNGLIEAAMIQKEERERAYTGKKITRTIGSAYTVADTRFYKPWTDLHELLQGMDLLETDFRYDYYTGKYVKLTQEEKENRFNEICSHIFSKKHLFRQHPKEGYRQGALLPGPTDSKGNKRWYSVNSAVASAHGFLIYVLDPVGKDNTLDTHITGRSTASSLYAYNGFATVRNDVNPWNAPGYEGLKDLEEILSKIRKDYTIPFWVGYQLSARKEIDSDKPDHEKVYNLLTKSKSFFKENIIGKYGRKSLHRIIRENDSLFSDIMWLETTRKNFSQKVKVLVSRIFSNTELSAYEKILFKFARNYSKQSIAKETPEEKIKRIEEEIQDAKTITDFIETVLSKHPGKTELIAGSQILLKEIKEHILEYSEESLGSEVILKQHLPEQISEAFTLIDHYPENKNFDLLKEAEEKIRKYSIRIKENPESKKTRAVNPIEKKIKEDSPKIPESCDEVIARILNFGKDRIARNLTLSGHSLGGSIIQVQAYYMTVGNDRMPLPGATLKVRPSDDPGMNTEDNIDLYEKLLIHSELMEEMKSKIDIRYSHDFGDFVPMGAPAHLGGYNKEINEHLLYITEALIKEDKFMSSSDFTEHFALFLTNHPGIQEEVKTLFAADEKETKPINPSLLMESEAGKKILLSFIKEKIEGFLQVNTLLKRNSKRTLEPEAIDINFKHATRFETTKVEKRLLLNINKNLLDDIENKKFRVNFSIVANFILNLQIHPKMQELSRQQKEYDHLITALTDKKVIEKEDLEKIKTSFPIIYTIYSKKKKLTISGNRLLRKIKKSIDKSHKQLVKSYPRMHIFLLQLQNYEDLTKNIFGKKCIEKEDLEVLKTNFKNIYTKYSKKKKLNISGNVLLREVKKSIKKSHRRLLNSGKKAYTLELKDQIKIWQPTYLGGTSITYIDRELLGKIGSADINDRKETRKVWGAGIIDFFKMQWIAHQVGINFAPFLQGKQKDPHTPYGHGHSIPYQNPRTKILAVNKNSGPFL